MKTILLFLLLCVACRNIRQPEVKAFTYFNKDTTGTSYWISDSIDIDNGKNEPSKVFFQCAVDSSTWDSIARIYDGTDQRLFYWVAKGISEDAQYKLNNPESFQPFKKQFLEADGNRFVCEYGLMGRNGFGNLVESKVFAEYKPFEDSMLFKYKH